MINIKCIIFDCDGVLVDSEPIGNRILLSMAGQHGLEMTMEQSLKEFSGRGLKDCLLKIENILNKKLPDDFTEEFRSKTYAAYKAELKPVKGVLEFINTLKIEYCVASSGPMEKIRMNLALTGMIDKFENKMFSSYQINSWKPDPEIFLFAADEMGFSVNECFVIEDSRAGVISAVKGGFKVFGFGNEKNRSELEDEGAIVFYDFENLSEIMSEEDLKLSKILN